METLNSSGVIEDSAIVMLKGKIVDCGKTAQ
jgi:hypothetical protein